MFSSSLVTFVLLVLWVRSRVPQPSHTLSSREARSLQGKLIYWGSLGGETYLEWIQLRIFDSVISWPPRNENQLHVLTNIKYFWDFYLSLVVCTWR